MLQRIAAMFGAAGASGESLAPPQEGAAAAPLLDGMAAINSDPYLQLADAAHRLVSVFDDLKYDRSDADMLSPAMRAYAIRKLTPLGFEQVSGNVLQHAGSGERVLFPKSHALGASPFDVTRYTPKRPEDFYLLTPTQTACLIIDSYGKDDAVGRIKELIAKHPVNLYRLMDYLEKKDSHQHFLDAIGHLRFVQREAVSNEPLRRRRALG